jgi:hypothetical protein
MLVVMEDRERRLARLRRAFAEDWARIRREVAGAHEHDRGGADGGPLREGQLPLLDEALDDVGRWLTRARVEVGRAPPARRAALATGLDEVAAQIAEARRQRQALTTASASARAAQLAAYAAAVARVHRAWQSLGEAPAPPHLDESH